MVTAVSTVPVSFYLIIKFLLYIICRILQSLRTIWVIKHAILFVLFIDVYCVCKAVHIVTLSYFYQLDVRSTESVAAALKNVGCVFHLASYGMSGREMVFFYESVFNLDGILAH